MEERVPGGFNIPGMILIFGIIFYGLVWILESFLINEVDLNLASVTVAAIYTSLFNALFVMCLTHMADEKVLKPHSSLKRFLAFSKMWGWMKYLTLIVFMTLFGGLINLLIELIPLVLDLPALGWIPILVAVTLLAYAYLFSF